MGQIIDGMLQDQMPRTDQDVQAAAAAAQSGRAETLGDVLRPVLNFEKNDVLFWVQIAQLVVLVLILREVS